MYCIPTSKSMTKLNKSATHARKTIVKAKKIKNITITAEQFVKTACQRDDPAAWLDEVQTEVNKMRRTLGLTTAPTSKPARQITTTTTTKFLPPWFDVMHKSKEIKCKSRYVNMHLQIGHFYMLIVHARVSCRKGKEYTRIRRFPNELAETSINLMVHLLLYYLLI